MLKVFRPKRQSDKPETKYSIPLVIAFFLVLVLFGGYTYFLSQSTCPSGYILVPERLNRVCIAKYEMKKGENGEALSVPQGLPWRKISIAGATNACRNLGRGYDLISYLDWTEIANQLSEVGANWSSGQPFLGKLNAGYVKLKAPAPLEASDDDLNDNCINTGEECDSVKWNVKRRTHEFKDGSIVWDLAGNAGEYVSGTVPKPSYKSNHIMFLSNVVEAYPFLPENECSPEKNIPSNNFCGYGFFNNIENSKTGIIVRGGDWTMKRRTMVGLYTTVYGENDSDISFRIGFRCKFQMLPEINTPSDLLKLF